MEITTVEHMNGKSRLKKITMKHLPLWACLRLALNSKV